MEDDFLSLIFMSERSVLDLVLSGEGGVGRLRKGRKQEMWYVCQCPLWKQEPLSIKSSADYYLLVKMVPVGKTAGTEARHVLITKSSGTDLIVDRG